MMALLGKSGTGCYRQWLPVALAAVLTIFTAHIPSKALTDGPFWTDGANGLAIGGFDPVSYFTEATARQGSRDLELVHWQVAWRFANEGNLDAFRRNPEIYAPQFGGRGAYAMATGRSNQGNPLIWEVVGGKLYFFFSEQARNLWLEDAAVMIEAAEAQWEAM